MKFFLALFCMFFILAAYADDESGQTTEPAKTGQAIEQSVGESQYQRVTQYCPKPEELVKQGMVWRVGTTWKSYSQSFAASINSFIGAQWFGIKFGNIICLYQGAGAVDFPIALEPVTPVLVEAPTESTWVSVKNHPGVRECLANKVDACPFTQDIPQPPKDIYATIKYQYKATS